MRPCRTGAGSRAGARSAGPPVAGPVAVVAQVRRGAGARPERLADGAALGGVSCIAGVVSRLAGMACGEGSPRRQPWGGFNRATRQRRARSGGRGCSRGAGIRPPRKNLGPCRLHTHTPCELGADNWQQRQGRSERPRIGGVMIADPNTAVTVTHRGSTVGPKFEYRQEKDRPQMARTTSTTSWRQERCLVLPADERGAVRFGAPIAMGANPAGYAATAPKSGSQPCHLQIRGDSS